MPENKSQNQISASAAFSKLQEYEQRSDAFAPGKNQGKGTSGEWSGITFRLGDLNLACDGDRILEVLPLPQATPVPGAKPWILGLANVRGSILTIVDLTWFLTGERSSLTSRSRLLSSQLHKAPVGLLIDEVLGQRHFLSEDATDADLPQDSPLQWVVTRKHKVGAETWHEFDIDRLFSSQDFLNGAAE